MKKAVWSFWSLPFELHFRSAWASERHHWMAWCLSVECARRLGFETSLLTDDAGAATLVDHLQLPFDSVSLALNALGSADPHWWVLGKLYAYSMQTEPFVHIDSDVFLWKDLPARLKTASVLGQDEEEFPFGGPSHYRPDLYDRRIVEGGGWAPEEWQWYTALNGNKAVCCGILGGNDVAFIAHYAKTAMQFLQHPSNLAVWAPLTTRIGDAILFEQYFLSACIAFHRHTPASPHRPATVEYLFPTYAERIDPTAAARVGYTHLIGASKRNPKLVRRLEHRLARDFPQYYKRATGCVLKG
jgi:hypothetical protein